MTVLHRFKRISLTLVISVLVVSALTRIVSASLSGLPEATVDGFVGAPIATQPDSRPNGDVASLIRNVAQRSAELDQREMNLALREQDMAIARQEIETALTQMAAAEARLSARMQQSATASDTDVDQLVEVYEGMKPKEAAVLFEAMEPAFAAGFLARMSTDRAAALFSNLSPEKAYALSVLIAGRNANAATE